jgi:hypothetical protein
MALRKNVFGFGFMPLESQHHFLVIIPRGSKNNIIVYERFQWQDGEDEQKIDFNDDRPKVEISKYKWKQKG